MYPEYPPRVRLERLIATARVVLAAGAFGSLAISSRSGSDSWPLNVVLAGYAGYVVYSLIILGLVWTPVRFAAGWALAVQLFDLLAFSLLSALSFIVTAGLTSPFYVYFVFLVICGALRWQSRGALWTAAASIGAYALLCLLALNVLHLHVFTWNTFAVRSVHLAVLATLVGCMAAYQRRYEHEISRLISWPRKIPPDPKALIEEILTESAEILDAPRIALVWETAGEGHVNLALRANGDVTWTQEPEARFGSLVIPGLEGKNFQAADAADEQGSVFHLAADGFRQRRGRPVSEVVQRRLDMRSVQSWTLDGELARGRMFCLDKYPMRLDSLPFGVLVARLAVSRLDSLYLMKHLRETTVLEERLRVARDLHDGLVQSVAGSALQLLAARRLLDRDPAAAAKRLEEVQNQLERGELDMRAFIRRLRPPHASARAGIGFEQRLEELCGRVERQWDIKVKMRVQAKADDWPDALADEVYRIVQEGVLNAARHADASLATVDLSTAGNALRLEIADDGRGFPFRGTFDLRALNDMNRGPLTLKERVGELHGNLQLKSQDTGTELLITLPLANVAG